MSRMVVADKELIVESSEDIAAENSATITSPIIPCGRFISMNLGTARLKL